MHAIDTESKFAWETFLANLDLVFGPEYYSRLTSIDEKEDEDEEDEEGENEQWESACLNHASKVIVSVYPYPYIYPDPDHDLNPDPHLCTLIRTLNPYTWIYLEHTHSHSHSLTLTLTLTLAQSHNILLTTIQHKQISDKDKGLDAALKQELPNAQHFFCSQHRAANVKESYGEVGTETYFNLVNATRDDKFNRIWNEAPSEVTDYISKTQLSEQFPLKAEESTHGKTASSGIEGMNGGDSINGGTSLRGCLPDKMLVKMALVTKVLWEFCPKNPC